jgi:CcmD family protein
MSRVTVWALALLVLLPSFAAAQGAAPPSLRPYWHVFIAYALVWVILFGWVVAIARRLGRVEVRIDRSDDRNS